MSDAKQVDHLHDVYSAESVDTLAETYDAWAQDYDADMLKAGYRHPMICIGLLARHVAADAGTIVDAGVGTGLLGEWLKILGYRRVAGFDLSSGMLEVARRKGAYDDLRQAALGKRLPYEDGAFAAAVCGGVFTIAHADPSGLDELLRIVRPGGHVVLTVKDKLYEEGFETHLETLSAAGRCRLVEMTPSYLSMPNQEGQSTSRALVLQVLAG
ncbi:Methyltransferase domain-containing protein [Tistlia consotensis]|uniref:Methyltransferase domain-containing protein n=1 Tax=Tistlia consotensis USBA 355 TaxID=560819 RepID=A0A1Y6BYE9_9PROT|nr:class I SAM-dependent methyltransferase [Tistlia consotensis]SMF36046.1 Methyltransferase domain-containing protein [Tistlia consotensis USBA 355]SNR71313.1 Methyltransferase domain-containing protein [Tistlia consotensis]